MLIKEVCKATGLTARTVRFYIEKGLIDPKVTPKNTNEYREYSQEDVQRLINISYLRKLLFSIQDIKEMLEEPDKIKTIVENHKKEVEEETEKQKEVLTCLMDLDMSSVSSVESLAVNLQLPTKILPLPSIDVGPDFGKFDTETEEEKEEAYLDFRIHQRIREKVDVFFKPIKKTILIASIITAVVITVILISGIPRKLEKSYQAIQYRYNKEEEIKKINIVVKGKLYKRLFSDTRFTGSIVISNYRYTKTYELMDVVFNGGVSDGMGNLVYWTIKEGASDMETLGAIWMEGNFDKIAIWVFEPLYSDSKTSTDLFIAAPADNREEALEITDRLSHYGK